MKYSKPQIYTIIAAALFLTGSVFLLVNTFTADVVWTFWLGLLFSIAATAVYVLLVVENRKSVSQNLAATAKPAKSPEENQFEVSQKK